MARIAVFQHVWCEDPGVFGEELSRLGHTLSVFRLDEGVAVPSVRDFDAWLVMGGPMNVDEIERYPYLRAERDLLADLIAADQPVLGVCLGSQLIARAAGSRVYAQRPKEIGLYPVALTPEGRSDPLLRRLAELPEVLHWHGDTFDLPAGAVHLARSERFDRQAFRVGARVYALQFHIEATPAMAGRWAEAFSGELAEQPPADQWSQFLSRMERSLEAQNRVAREVIRGWADLI